MKNRFLKLMMIAVTLIISFSAECMAGNTTSHSVSLKKRYKEHNQDLDPEGVRMPANITCFISIDGFQSDIDPNDIISYEIWDEPGNICRASFLEDIPFCHYLFNTPGNYQIRISTTDFILIGYISTL